MVPNHQPDYILIGQFYIILRYYFHPLLLIIIVIIHQPAMSTSHGVPFFSTAALPGPPGFAGTTRCAPGAWPRRRRRLSRRPGPPGDGQRPELRDLFHFFGGKHGETMKKMRDSGMIIIYNSGEY